MAIYDQGPVSVEVVDAFQKSFPKVKLNSLRARGSQIGPKVIAERRAHKYLVAQINQFKEGVSLTSSGGTISLLNRAPHPNGAKIFVNWLLSRDAQSLIQKTDGSESLRIDIPKDSVLSGNRRVTGVEYLDGDDPKFSDRRPADKLLNEVEFCAARAT